MENNLNWLGSNKIWNLRYGEAQQFEFKVCQAAFHRPSGVGQPVQKNT